MIVVLSDAAEADLESIGDWIAKDSPWRAHTFVGELREVCKRLGDMPKAYPLLPRHKRSGIRRRPYGDYLIFYHVAAQVEILHVLHSARDYERVLFPPKA